MIHDVLFAIWFLLPAAAANVSPILAAHVPLLRHWRARLDFGKNYHGKAIFGRHKSWRGLVSGIVVATIVLAVQQFAVWHSRWAADIVRNTSYAALPTLLLGPLFGFGALGGDAIESFFKRRRHIPPGHSWLPFDQLDYIIGGILFSLPFIRLSLREYIYMFIIWFVVHLAASYIGFRVGLKDRPI